MMRHMSELEAEVPVEQFRDRKCTFLELFQVPGTPIFLKICRELGEHVGDTTGQLFSQGKATGYFSKREWPASQNRWPAGHLPKSVGKLVFSPSFLYILSPKHFELITSATKSSPLASQTIFSLRSELYTRFPTPYASCFHENIQFQVL